MTLGRTKALLFAAATAGLLANAPVWAADASAPLVSDTHEWDIAFGVTFTSDYISRGYTQTDHGAAIQPWAELDIGKFYFGYWGSNVSPVSVGANWEHDLSIGIRPSLGPVDFDFGYVRYIYDNGDCCGELYAKASFSPIEPVTVGGAVFYDPDASATYVEGNGSIDLHNNISASAAVGYSNGSGATSWNAGLSWAPQEWVKLDGRYYGGPEANRFVVSLSLQSSAKALGLIH
jgi:uncharacterized protein (TIGR02001 family)